MNEISNLGSAEMLNLNVDGDSTSIGTYVNTCLKEIQSQYSEGLIAKISYTEIAALGPAFSAIVQAFHPSVSEPLYRCIFPEGVEGVLAQAKDGSGALGTILKKGGGFAQARWVEAESVVPFDPTIILVSVAILGIAKQVADIKQGQKDIIDILERDKKNQLLADYDILSEYMADYRYYWENATTVTVNLNQVKNILRNAEKDVRSYKEQLEQLTSQDKLFDTLTPSKKIGRILDRFIHFKLSLHVKALASYLEVMLARNFQSEYLDKVAKELRENAFQYKSLYTSCYDKIEALKKECVESQISGSLAKLSKTVGKAIGGIPVIQKGPIDELLITAGESLDAADKKHLEDTLKFFVKYKDSGLIPVANHIDVINQMAHCKTETVWTDSAIYLMSDKK